MTATKIAAVVRCNMSMVHWSCRSGALAEHAHQKYGAWLIDPAALEHAAVWEQLTGTADRRRWAPEWTGSRLGKKKRAKLGLP